MNIPIRGTEDGLAAPTPPAAEPSLRPGEQRDEFADTGSSDHLVGNG